MLGIIVEVLGFIIYWFIADWTFDYTLNRHDKRFWFLLLAPIVMSFFLNFVKIL